MHTLIFVAGAGVLPILGMLAIPLAPNKPGEPLRVLIFGRISTPHQRQESIEASYEFAEKFLGQAYHGKLSIERLGEQASGMVADRRTIRAAEDLIAEGKVDVVLVEDVGRIYRDPRHLIAFVNDAADAGVRLISINDGLDTADEDWEVLLSIAMIRHGFAATDAKKRVNRTAAYAFQRGGDVKKLVYGYRKLGKEEASSGQYGTVGLRMAKLSECTSVIMSMREMVLAGSSYQAIANWLNSQGIRPGRYSKKGFWTAKIVIDLLRSPLMHGERLTRKVIHQRVRKTGRHKRLKNPNPDRKSYPELAHMTSEEHESLLAKMDGMAAERRHHAPGEHPRTRVPRSNGIWPCALDVTCNACTRPAYVYYDDQLKCLSSFLTGDHQCWNHVQIHREAIRAAVIPWIVRILQQSLETWNAFVESASQEIMLQREGEGSQLAAAEKLVAQHEEEADRLGRAIASGDRKLETLLKLLAQTEAAITEGKTRCGELRAKSANCQLPDRETFLLEPLPPILELSRTSFEFAALLRRIVKKLTIVPVQDLMHGQVRARIKVGIEFSGSGEADANGDVVVHNATFDVFDPPLHIAYIDRVRELKRQQPNASHAKIANGLGIGKMTVKRTLQYIKLMEESGVSEPFVELVTKPPQASRWRHRDDAAKYEPHANVTS